MTEFGFIDRIKDLFATLPDNGFEGIGDDCAIPVSYTHLTLPTKLEV